MMPASLRPPQTGSLNRSMLCLILAAGMAATLHARPASKHGVPDGVGVGGVLFAPFSYRRAWDNNRNPHPIGADQIDAVNTWLGAPLVDGTYQADYTVVAFDLYAGLTPRLTFHLQLPYFRAEVRQRIDILAPPAESAVLREQLQALGFNDETLKDGGWGDLQGWLLYHYLDDDQWTLTIGTGWRTALFASDFSHQTERLNVVTRESEAALLKHLANVELFPGLTLAHQIELQYPLEGHRDVFQPGAGVRRVRHTPGRYLTHELEVRAQALGGRVTAAAGVWYREEHASRSAGRREATGRDYLWWKAVLGYNGMADYENGILPIPFVFEIRHWHLESARNTRAYSDSYWEFWLAFPLWSF